MFPKHSSTIKKIMKMSYSLGVISLTLAMLMSVINFQVFASESFQAAYNCSDFDLKTEGAGTVADERGDVTISSDKRTASWGANEGWVISAVCVKGGNPGNENGFYYEWSYPNFGNWTADNEQADISHAGVKFAIATPVPPTPTNTATNTTVPPTPTNTATNTTVPPTKTPTNTPVTPTTTSETPTTQPPTATPKTPTPQEPTPTPQEPTETPVTTTPQAPTPTPLEPTETPVTPTPGEPTPTPQEPTATPEQPTEVPPTPTLIIPVTGETPTATAIIPVTGQTPQPQDPTAVPTLAAPTVEGGTTVLIPVTGGELTPVNPIDIVQKMLLNGGIGLIGFALVLQGIHRKFE